jgi:predicted  nucleic acid-binding Zn-ribbon protein
MAETPENPILDHLRALRSDMSGLREDVRDIKRRMTSLEMAVSQVHGDFSGRSMRIDRLENPLERIEHRLDPTD